MTGATADDQLWQPDAARNRPPNAGTTQVTSNNDAESLTAKRKQGHGELHMDARGRPRNLTAVYRALGAGADVAAPVIPGGTVGIRLLSPELIRTTSSPSRLPLATEANAAQVQAHTLANLFSHPLVRALALHGVSRHRRGKPLGVTP